MNRILATITILLLAANASYSQTINWKAVRSNQHSIIQLNFGYDFGMAAQVGFSRAIDLIGPTLLGLDISLPMGSNLIDDFKIKLGGQMEIVEVGEFSTSIKIASVFRRYETELVSIVSFGSDVGVVAGYYKPTWHAAGEIGFDKAITSHLKHSGIMKSFFLAIKDGWYVPTGRHFSYGIQAGKTLGTIIDLGLRVGASRAQLNDENAVLPYYLQVGLGMKL